MQPAERPGIAARSLQRRLQIADLVRHIHSEGSDRQPADGDPRVGRMALPDQVLHCCPDDYQGDGHDVNRWSENTYAGWGSNTFTTARAAVTWWMNSPTHKANIIDRNVTKLGVGVRAGAARPGFDTTDPACIFVQQFISCS